MFKLAKIDKIKYLLILLFLAADISISQTNINSISAGFGTIRNMSNFQFEDDVRAFYPEIQIGGSFLKEYLFWEIYFGYWNYEMVSTILRYSTGVNHSSYSSFSIQYSTECYNTGFRIGFTLSKAFPEFKIPVSFFTGISHQFISHYSEIFDGEVEEFYPEYSNDINAFETGAKIDVNIIDHISLFGKAEIFYPFRTTQTKRYTLSLGLSYYF